MELTDIMGLDSNSIDFFTDLQSDLQVCEDLSVLIWFLISLSRQ